MLINRLKLQCKKNFIYKHDRRKYIINVDNKKLLYVLTGSLNRKIDSSGLFSDDIKQDLMK